MENEEFNEVYDQKEVFNDFPKTLLDVVKEEYDSLIDYLIEKVLPGRKEYENFFENNEFSINQGIIDLDIILQYSLIELTFKQGKISDEVLEMIEAVCKYGSLLDEIHFTQPYFAWIDFNMLDNEKSGELLKSLGVYISKVSRDFSKFFALAEPNEEDINFAKEVQQKMNNIINAILEQNMDAIGSENRSACLANAIFKQLIK